MYSHVYAGYIYLNVRISATPPYMYVYAHVHIYVCTDLQYP